MGIADGDHCEGLTSTVALSFFMVGLANKPSPPPSPSPIDDPNATPKPWVDPYTPRKTCGDGSSCSVYGSYITSNPGYWCGFFGSQGTYCKDYGLTMYCCLDMCGECDVNPPTQAPSGAPTNDMTKKGGLQTTWTSPEWMEITWDNLPVASQRTQSALLEMFQLKPSDSQLFLHFQFLDFPQSVIILLELFGNSAQAPLTLKSSRKFNLHQDNICFGSQQVIVKEDDFG